MTMMAMASPQRKRQYDRTPRVESKTEARALAAAIVTHLKRLAAAGRIRRAAHELQCAIEDAWATDRGERARWLKKYGASIMAGYEAKKRRLGYKENRSQDEEGTRRGRVRPAGTTRDL